MPTLTRDDAEWLFIRTGGQERPEVLERDDDDCPIGPLDDEKCMNCGEHPPLNYPIPCPCGQDDRALCLDCAYRLGHDISE